VHDYNLYIHTYTLHAVPEQPRGRPKPSAHRMARKAALMRDKGSKNLRRVRKRPLRHLRECFAEQRGGLEFFPFEKRVVQLHGRHGFIPGHEHDERRARRPWKGSIIVIELRTGT